MSSIPTINTKSIPPIHAKLLTPEGFSPFGGVISSKHQLKTMSSKSANYGTATKLFQVSPIINNYNQSPSTTPAKANFNLFRCSPPDHLIERELDKSTYKCKVLERHPFSTQTFLPLGRDKDEIAYIVIVAHKKDDDDLPDPSTIEAFIATGDQAVTYNVRTWHAPMVALNKTVDFAVLIHENGVPEEDCNEVYFDPGVEIVFYEKLKSESKI